MPRRFAKEKKTREKKKKKKKKKKAGRVGTPGNWRPGVLSKESLDLAYNRG